MKEIFIQFKTKSKTKGQGEKLQTWYLEKYMYKVFHKNVL